VSPPIQKFSNPAVGRENLKMIFFFFVMDGHTHLATRMPDGVLVELRLKNHTGAMTWSPIDPSLNPRFHEIPSDAREMRSVGLTKPYVDFVLGVNGVNG
jgi:hypothetical protein